MFKKIIFLFALLISLISPTQKAFAQMQEPHIKALGAEPVEALSDEMPEAVQNDRGLAVAVPAPAFELATDNGELKTFQDIRGGKGLVMVFSRSVEWCPFCQLQTLELDRAVQDIRGEGYELVVVTYDKPVAIKRFMERYDLRFPVLSDMGSKAIRSFDVLDESADPQSDRFGYALPIVFILDREGTVKSKLYDEDYRTRPEAAKIVSRLRSLD